MFRLIGTFSIIGLFVLSVVAVEEFRVDGRAAEPTSVARITTDPLLKTSAINAVIEANGGKPPTTGEQLWKVLGKCGSFAQLPIPFSAVRFDSGLSDPRVLIAPMSLKLSETDANQPNLLGRLYLAANMERHDYGGDPRVTSVEFISWNTATRRFDFGVIDHMGSDGEPETQLVDSGRCSSCHKNRGPIFCGSPWTNSAHLDVTRALVAKKLRLTKVSASSSDEGRLRDRIDGMALATSDAIAMDQSIAIGRQLRLHRETFQLMNRSPAGRKAFVAMLVAIAAPGEINLKDAELNTQQTAWENDPSHSYQTFTTDWQKLVKTTSSGVLIDYAPFEKELAKPPVARRKYGNTGVSPTSMQTIPSPPTNGFRSVAEARQFSTSVQKATESNENLQRQIALNTDIISRYDVKRAQGKTGMPSTALASNPKAFAAPVATVPKKSSGLVNAELLAVSIGLTKGDRQFIASALEQSANSLRPTKVMPRALAKAVFEGPTFADVLAGGPLPDRDDFKDRLVDGLNQLLKSKYNLESGFTADRAQYAYGPVFDPKTALEERVPTPTTACLRCHDVRPSGKARAFEPIPALPFDPFDKAARETWLKSAPDERKRDVLIRLQTRLFKDPDMPPVDAPENALFREKDSAAFDQLKEIIERELGSK